MSWLGRVARMGEIGNKYEFAVSKPENRIPVQAWFVNSSGSGYRPVAAFCEHGNEPSGSIEGWEFIDYLTITISFSNSPTLKMETAHPPKRQ
jgi:hypothetical protein